MEIATSLLQNIRECYQVLFSVLQRGIKIQGFDQIQKLFRRNSHQSMTIILGGKKKFRVRCTLKTCLLPCVTHWSSDKDTAAVYTMVLQSGPWWLVP